MKDKTIRKICRGKIYAWANSVSSAQYATENPESNKALVRKAILENAFVTGGAIVSMLQNEDVNDFDIYLRTYDATKLIAEYYVDLFKEENKNWVNDKVGHFGVDTSEPDRIKIVIKSQGFASSDEDGETSESSSEYQYFEATNGDQAEEFISELATRKRKEIPYSPIFLTDNAITLNNKIQLVIRFFGEPEEVHKNYDFVHCTSYYSIWDDHLEIPYKALRSIQDKELKYMGSLYPICSIIRLRKFIKRGWTINAGQILKMCFQISKLDLTQIKTLQDQLVGVDSAYFNELINVMGDDMEKGKTIDQTYVANLIDKIFD
jgi:hypothetical protein